VTYVTNVLDFWGEGEDLWAAGGEGIAGGSFLFLSPSLCLSPIFFLAEFLDKDRNICSDSADRERARPRTSFISFAAFVVDC
jgi:hypothetical protein